MLTYVVYQLQLDSCKDLSFDIKLYSLTVSVVALVTGDLTVDPPLFVSAREGYLVSRFH